MNPTATTFDQRIAELERAMAELLREPVEASSSAREPFLMFPIGELILTAAALVATGAVIWLWLEQGR